MRKKNLVRGINRKNSKKRKLSKKALFRKRGCRPQAAGDSSKRHQLYESPVTA